MEEERAMEKLLPCERNGNQCPYSDDRNCALCIEEAT